MALIGSANDPVPVPALVRLPAAKFGDLLEAQLARTGAVDNLRPQPTEPERARALQEPVSLTPQPGHRIDLLA